MRLVAASLVLVALVCPRNAFAHTVQSSNDASPALDSVRVDTNEFFATGAQVDITVKALPGSDVSVRMENGPQIPAVEEEPGVYRAQAMRYSHETPSTVHVVAWLQDNQGQSFSRSFSVTETLCASVHQTGVAEPHLLPSLPSPSGHPENSLKAEEAPVASAPIAPTAARPSHYEELPVTPALPVTEPATRKGSIINTGDNPYFDNSTVELVKHADGPVVDSGIDPNRPHCYTNDSIVPDIDGAAPHSYNNDSVAAMRQTYQDEVNEQPVTQVAGIQPDSNTGTGGQASNDSSSQTGRMPSGIVVHERPDFEAPSPSATPDAQTGDGAAPVVTSSAPPGYDSITGDATPAAPPSASPPATQYLPYGGYPSAPPVAPPVPATSVGRMR